MAILKKLNVKTDDPRPEETPAVDDMQLMLATPEQQDLIVMQSIVHLDRSVKTLIKVMGGVKKLLIAVLVMLILIGIAM